MQLAPRWCYTGCITCYFLTSIPYLNALQSRGVYESPGMTSLYLAHLDLETFCLDREVLKAMRGLKDLMTDYVYNGR